MTLLERVSRRLDDEGIGHALIGAAALAARGVARSTYDVDVLTTDAAVLTAELWKPLAQAGVAVDVRRGDADDPLRGVVRIELSGERPVDVVVGRWAWQARAVARAEASGSGRPPIVTASDLVLLKLYAGGTQDLWDVRALLELDGADRLIADVEADLRDLPADMRGRWRDTRR